MTNNKGEMQIPPGMALEPLPLSLRDYFAGQALQGLVLAACIAGAEMFKPEQTGTAAYNYADAMLAAREAGRE
jgi:hypothetical protein